MVDDLDLTGVLAKAKSGALASPSDVLMAIRSAWQAVHASNVAANRLGADQSASAAAVASESRLADALLHVHQCWLEEHLAGTVVDEDDFTAHVVAVNYKCVKTAFTSMAEHLGGFRARGQGDARARRGEGGGALPHVRAN